MCFFNALKKEERKQMASAERNEEKNVKTYNYEWQTDEEIVANAHTKMSFHGREETTLLTVKKRFVLRRAGAIVFTA